MLPEIKTELPGPRSLELYERSRGVEAGSIKRQFPIAWQRARGVEVEDVDGNRFLDFTASVLVANIGHNHPAVVQAIKDQADLNLHSYNFLNPWRIRLAELLVEISPPSLDRAFIATTGAEVIELAVNVAKQFTGRREVLSFFGGYHGKTYGAASYGGKAGNREGFGPALPGVLHAPFANCYRCDFGLDYPSCELRCFSFIDRLLECQGTKDLAAVIVEPFQGAGGQIDPPSAWMQRLADWCRRREVVLILDEVQASFGRTGRMFAFEHHDIVPNMVVVGKGVAGGMPLTALIGESRILAAVKAGSLSSTHGGNPLATRVACETIDIIRREDLCGNSERVGGLIKAMLKDAMREFDIIGDVRGVGMMLGVEIVTDRQSHQPAPDLASRIVEGAIRRGLLMIKPIGFYNNVLRISPPLILTEEQARTGVTILLQAIREVCASVQPATSLSSR